MFAPDPLWYRDAIIYELHVKAFFDSNDDGVGDFPGLIQKLDYLQDLGVNCIWLLPFFPSPMRDDGYDIADYHGVHPGYGRRKHVRQFVREAHERGIRVVIELVINHTSDQHPWFQAARNAPPGSTKRDFYVWSDTPTKYAGARIIFTDTETSNWTWDPVAKAYFWHRFFGHQPDLNYDNPLVLRAIFKVMRFWFDMGVDGMRLDAIPYLIEREGTNCENLPESHDIIKKIRREMDKYYADKMLLAEANQWPADVLPYFGDGDECNMAFHFPLMPRIFMALRQEDRHPIVEIMRQTPDLPPDCQWAIFLRNHDELTLEMVTEEERDYMYREYAADPRMRINIGIRRRLAPLIGNSRPRIELLNSLVMSLPGTPCLYYGDEIGMGDNIYLGDRNGVRTPMQWTGDRNAGFSRCDFNRLYSPPVIDPVYGYQSINVEAQQREASSLLNWMKRIIALRKRYKAFGRGTIEFLSPANRKVLVYLRKFEEEVILCVANLSRFVQPVEIDLAAYAGTTPVELFGRVRFPAVGSAPYFVTVGPSAFIWFQLDRHAQGVAGEPHTAPPPALETLPTLALKAGWETLMEGNVRAVLERTVLPRFMLAQRWFGAKSRTLETVSIRDWSFLDAAPEPAVFVAVRAYYNDNTFDTYAVPMAIAVGPAGEAVAEANPKAVMAHLVSAEGAGVLYDAAANDAFCQKLLALVAGSSRSPTAVGRLEGLATSAFAEARGEGDGPLAVTRGSGEQSNTTVVYGDRLILKMFRRLVVGVNPDYEVGRFLTETAHFDRTPKTAGALEYRTARSEASTLAILQELVPNQGAGWEWFLGMLSRYFEQVTSEAHRLDRIEEPGVHLLDLSESAVPDDVFEVVGAALRSAEVLGRRTAEMHLALASDPSDPAFAPEPLTAEELTRAVNRLRSQSREVFSALADRASTADAPLAELIRRVVAQGPALVERVCVPPADLAGVRKVRCHGDYHLGQVLWRENDYYIIDFEGEPARTLAERRAKQSPMKDVAGMLRSFDYAAYSELLKETRGGFENFERLEPWAKIWRTWTSASFLRAYRTTAEPGSLLPDDVATLRRLLDFFTVDKLVFEVRYEMNYRPDWVRIPLLGLLELIRPPAAVAAGDDS